MESATLPSHSPLVLENLKPTLIIDNKRQINTLTEIDDSKIAVSGEDSLINIYNLADGKVLFSIKEFVNKVSQILPLADGSFALSSFDGQIKILKFVQPKEETANSNNNKNYEIQQVIQGNPEAKKINKIIELPDGRIISGDEKFLISWKKKEPEGKIFVAQKEIKINEPVLSLLLFEKINLLLCATAFSHIFFIDVKHNIKQLKFITSSTSNDCLNKVNNKFVLSYGGKSISVINIEKMANLKEIRIDENIDYIYVLNENSKNKKGDRLLIATETGGNEKKGNVDLQMFDIDLNKYRLKKINEKKNVHENGIVLLNKLKNGKLITASRDYRIKIWE